MQRTVDFEKGEYILREFEVADCAYVVMQGEVGIFKHGADNTIIPLGIVKAGEDLGELGVVSGQHRTAEAIALTSVTAVKITKEVLDLELSKAPSWISALLIGLSERLAKTDELLRVHQAKDAALLAKIEPVVKMHLTAGKRRVS